MARRGGGDFFDNVEPLFGRQVRPPNLSDIHISRGTRRLLIIGAAVLVFLFVVNPLVGLYIDNAWFGSLGFKGIFQTRLGYQARLGIGGFVVAFLVLAVNAVFALRLLGPAALSKIGVRKRVLDTAAGRLAVVGAALVALIFSRVAVANWETVALALNATPFGRSDPVFNQDVGFYIFQLPAWEFAWGWVLGIVVVAFISAGAIYASRSTATPGSLELPAGAVAHMSLLGSAFFLLLAAHYRIAMYSMVVSKGISVVFGAGYTDLNLRLPMYWVMLVLVLLLALALLANVFLARPFALAAAPVVWLVLVVLLLGAAPPLYQFFFVKPNEAAQESDNIRREIEATNRAYGLDNIVFKDFTDQATITPELLANNSGTVNNLRLWDYGPLKDTYNQIQTIRQYYDFHDVDIDRYTLSDGYRQVMISARELSPNKLPENAKTWVNQHLSYTHGYGAAATPVTKVAGEGLPDLVLKDIPPTGEPKIDRPQIYFGETTTSYVIVDTQEKELDFEKENIQQYSSWDGTNGVKLSLLPKLAFAYQLADPNILLSSQVTDGSQMLFRRDLSTRLKTLAPFLTYDSDPYIVVAGGRMEWMVDAYTTADKYPYSDPYDATLGVNYIRNAVKVVVDPYDGSVTFYIADDKDPVIQTYAKIFPGTFHPISEMPSELRAHVRYPEGLFNIQSERLRNYHMRDPNDFYRKADSWAQPNEVKGQGGTPQPLQPYYVMMRLPGEDHEEFVLIQPYTPLNKANMVAWLAARSDGAAYGQLVAVRFPTNRQVTGPGQVESRIDQDTVISPALTLLNSNGSQVRRGNLLVIPIGDGLLYVEPVFIASTSTNAVPELKKVIVADETRVVWADTLTQALALLSNGQVSTVVPQPGTTQPSTPSQGDLIKRANDLYADAQNKLKNGDFKGYADDIQQLGEVLKQLQPGGSPSASPGASPSISPAAQASP
ncbi:MAG: uncharacterized protein QOE92_1148 [Chloroflexota bacterium]|jgi:uncharacterized membrane protein (UPF0182 family)|nr:uncharacterized protein [Chloroflexota bacterium]